MLRQCSVSLIHVVSIMAGAVALNSSSYSSTFFGRPMPIADGKGSFAFSSHLTIDVASTSIVRCEPKAKENEVHIS